MIAITEQVAATSRRLPDFVFFRLVPLCSKDFVRDYLLNYENMEDRQAWMRKARSCTSYDLEHELVEQFENGSWTPYWRRYNEWRSEVFGEVYEGRLEEVDGRLSIFDVSSHIEEGFSPLSGVPRFSRNQWIIQFDVVGSSGEVVFSSSEMLVDDLLEKDKIDNVLKNAREEIRKMGYILESMAP